MERNTLDQYRVWAVSVYAPATVQLTDSAARSVARATGTTVEALDEDGADAWWTLLRRMSPQTRTSYLRGLRRFYSWRQTRTGQADPTRYLKAPAVRRGLPRPVDPGVVEVAVGLAVQPVSTWLGLGAWAGLRRSEIAGLRPEHAWLDGGRLVLRVVGKGGRERAVPVPDRLGQLLAGYGWPAVSTSTVYVAVRAALAAAGEDAGAPHRLRHTYATQVYGSSGDLLAVAQLLGHASVATTQVYAEASTSHLSEVVGRAFSVV